MSFRRRAVLAGCVAVAVGGGGLASLHALGRKRGRDVADRAQVEAVPLPCLDTRDPGRRVFGELTYRSGLVLTSSTRGFGGLSGLWRSPDGSRMVAVSDQGQWFTARVVTESGRLVGLADATLSPILGEAGEPLRETDAYDTESLAIADGVAYVGIERVHEVRRFAWARDGVAARGMPLPPLPGAEALARNRSLEAVAVVPAGHPLAGAVIAIAEQVGGGPDDPTWGWVATGPDRFRFGVARSDDFNITDAVFLPSGELLLLERRFTLLRGVACRMRRVAPASIRPDATIDGRIIFEVDRAYEIDNMEGLAFHRDPVSGEAILTLVSDDNFSPIQRTLLMEFSIRLP